MKKETNSGKKEETGSNVRLSKKILLVLAAVLVTFAMSMTVWGATSTRVMYVGTTYKINARGNYKWSSGNKKILRLNTKKKTMTPLKAGTTTLKATRTVKKKKKTITYKVIVKNPYISDKTAELEIGDSTKLTLTGTKAVKWSSSKSSVATVSSNGTVKAKKAGTAKITVTGKNKKKYTCTVKVLNEEKEPEEPAAPTPTPMPATPNAYLISHRGSTTTAPENTFAAFNLAVANGIRAIETDVQFTSDKVPVIIHDTTVNRTSNYQPHNEAKLVSDMTYDEIRSLDFGSWKGAEYAGEQIPNFKEFIQFCKANQVHPYIELKKEDNIEYDDLKLLYDIVCEEGMQSNVSWFSFNYDYLKWMKTIAPSADIGMIRHANTVITDAVIEATKKLKTGTNTVFLSYYADQISSYFVQRCKNEGIDLVARDVTSTAKWYSLDSYYRAAFINEFGYV